MKSCRPKPKTLKYFDLDECLQYLFPGDRGRDLYMYLADNYRYRDEDETVVTLTRDDLDALIEDDEDVAPTIRKLFSTFARGKEELVLKVEW